MERLDGMSMNIEQAEMEKLKAVFPQCFAEGKLDIDKLLSLCGEYIDNDFEKYKFEWKGKLESLKLAQKRSTGTLRPCREESVNFDDTQNLYIEGDNLEVLKLLQTAYYNKIKMIYIDPPYNTGSDFVYEDDFADPLGRYKQITNQTTKSNAETMGRYHTNWLNMIYPRIRLAHNLLKEDGAIFISIDENEVHNLRKVCDEIFGEENFVAQLGWQKVYSPKNQARYYSNDYEFVLCYAKSLADFKLGELPRTPEMNARYKNPDNDPRGDWKPGDCVGNGVRTNGYYDVVSPKTGKVFNVPQGKHWVYAPENMKKMIADNRIWFGVDGNSFPATKQFLTEVSGRKASSLLLHVDYGHTDMAVKDLKKIFDEFEKVPFDTPKPIKLIKMLMIPNTNDGDIILDFFSGSATTGHAVMQLNADDGKNRKFILVQLPELLEEKTEAYQKGYKSISDLGKERIRRAGAKVLEETESAQLQIGEEEKKPLDVGFKVFKLDTSNLKTWDGTPIGDGQLQMFYERLNSMIDTVKDDRTDMDVVYEVMLKMGITLDTPVTYIEVNNKIVYIVGEFLLMVCLTNNITAEDIEGIAAYAPAKIVCAEAGFADDSALSNAHYILKDKNIELKLV